MSAEGAAGSSGAGAGRATKPRGAGAGREPRPRSRRDRPAKPALSREAIVDAALAIVRDEGVDALTMRRIAQALDTGPASLYVYVANREELHELVFEAAVATVATEETDPEHWREQLHALAARMVDALVREFPGLARLAMAHIPIGDNAMRVAESMISLLKAGGVSDQAAAYGVDLISLFVTASAYEESLYAALYDPDHEQREIARIADRFSHLDPERYPTTAALAERMTAGDGDERFDLGLDVIVNGLLQTPTEGRLTSWPRD
jgi:AcrR family transcriptional regulator